MLVLQPTIAKEKPGKWLKPSLIDITDSYRFCHDCGTALGWFLGSDVSEEDIRKGWKRLIGGKDNNGISIRPKYSDTPQQANQS